MNKWNKNFNNNLKNPIQKKKMTLYGIIVFIWMAVIFIYSSQNGSESGKSSTELTRFMLDMLIKAGILSSFDFTSPALVQLEGSIRTAAHFTEYLIFGIFAFQLSRHSIAVKSIEKVALSVVFCTFYAMTDEFHQYFVPGRAMQLEDLLVDFAGVLCGVFLIFFVTKTKERKQLMKKPGISIADKKQGSSIRIKK